MKNILSVVLLFISASLFGQVTKVGNDTLMDIACWNIEWFGSTTMGPNNEAIQFDNVKSVLQNTEMDVWGLCEISDNTIFNSLITQLGTYDAALSTFDQTQKTGLIWKKNKFTLISQKSVLTDNAYSNDFAGRPPLEVVLRTKGATPADTLYFYVIHMKANIGTQQEKLDAYARRQNAGGYLKNFIDQYRRNKKVIVLGDWNDDLDQSILRDNGNYLATPYTVFLNDSNTYFYNTLRLSQTGQKSTVSYTEMIDHIMNSRSLSDSFYVQQSSAVMSELTSQIAGYGNSTSDHFPVYARFNLKRPTAIQPVGITEYEALNFSVNPNPANGSVSISSDEPIDEVFLINTKGEKILVEIQANKTLNISNIVDGLYMLLMRTNDGQQATSKLLIKHD